MRSALSDVARVLGVDFSLGMSKFVAKCPAHEDASPSLSVAERDGKLLFNCFTGCTYDAVRESLESRGLTLREPGDMPAQNETVWTIRDVDGKPIAQHVRIDRAEGKQVFWRGPAGERVKLSDLGIRVDSMPLYGCEQLANPDARDRVVVVCEGEKAADALRRLDVLALGTVTGAASAPQPVALECLRGRMVYLWPDNDTVGAQHMERIAKRLAGIAASVETIRWEGAPEAGDAADFVAAGKTRGDVDALLATPVEPVGFGMKFLWEGVKSALEELDRFQVGDQSRYVPTGLPSLDRKMGGGLKRGTLTLVGAPTGNGKTTLLEGFAVAAGKAGALLISPEMSLVELAERELIRQSQWERFKRAPWARGEKDKAADAHARAAANLFNERLNVLVYDEPDVNMDAIEQRARAAKRMLPNLALVAIDYAQEVADDDPRRARYLTVGEVAKRSVVLARELDCAVVVASQVNVVQQKGGPAEYVFRESSVLEHKAHSVLVFAVDWQQNPQGGGRVVTSAELRAKKMRGAGAFFLPVRYEPALYTVSDIETEVEWNGSLR